MRGLWVCRCALRATSGSSAPIHPHSRGKRHRVKKKVHLMYPFVDRGIPKFLYFLILLKVKTNRSPGFTKRTPLMGVCRMLYLHNPKDKSTNSYAVAVVEKKKEAFPKGPISDEKPNVVSSIAKRAALRAANTKHV